MPPKRKRKNVVCRASPPPRSPTPPPPVGEQEQPDEEESAACGSTDAVPEHVAEEALEGDEDAPARRKTARNVTSFSEDEKELIIDFLQQNPMLYSKRLAGYKNTALKESLWTEQANRMNRTPTELKTWYDSMRTKLGKLKKAASKSGQGADTFTITEK